jgi:uncharacterized protein YjiS (DUF1127 family)
MRRHCPPAPLEVAPARAISAPDATSTVLLLRRVTRWALAAGIERLLLWHEISRQRKHLAVMDDRMLRDIGLTRADVAREAEKPFWRL